MPFFGICLGMQMAVIEFARNVCGLRGANSTEFDPTPPHPVIDLMPEQRGVTDKGATMRLGAYPCVLTPGSHAAAAYGASEISERHRHRYEVNNDYREALDRPRHAALGRVARRPAGRDDRAAAAPVLRRLPVPPRVQVAPQAPHPLFQSFIAAALSARLGDRRAASGRGLRAGPAVSQ